MSLTVTAPSIGRDLELGMFTDITAAPCVQLDGSGAVFDDSIVAVTSDQQNRIRIRMMTCDSATEQLYYAAYQAIANNNAFLVLNPPTNAQAIAQVQALTQQMNKVIKVLLELES